jgi:hypothetical protein
MDTQLIPSRKRWYAIVALRLLIVPILGIYAYGLLLALQQGTAEGVGTMIGHLIVWLILLRRYSEFRAADFIDYVAKKVRALHPLEIVPVRHAIPVIHWRVGGLSDISKYPPRKGHAGYVYLIQELNDGNFKIGRTRNPNNRLETFGVTLPAKVDYICLIPTENTHLLERKLHRQFARRRVAGEWFALSDEDVASVIALAGKGG